MSRVLILSATTGYQTHAFDEAAARLGIDLVLATDRCHMLEDPWRDRAIPIRFHDESESVRTIVDSQLGRPFAGVLALGDRPTVIAALVAEALGLPGHPAEAARVSRSKLATRETFAAAGLPVPWFRSVPLDENARAIASDISFPCVVKPLALSASRGVIRANDTREFEEAFARVARLLRQKDIRALRDSANDRILIEGFLPGREFAVEGIVEGGILRVLTVFEKPDPLDGPFFEETIYVTPPRIAPGEHGAIVSAISRAIEALGLRHGPIHAECRLHTGIVHVLEVAARPIGGLCARALRFEKRDASSLVPFEDVLLRHAIGERLDGYFREPAASGLMMIPIPRGGYYREVSGLDAARAVSGVDEIHITAKSDQLLLPLPEGSSYLGFIFARGATADAALDAVRSAHAKLAFTFDAPMPVVSNER